MNWYYVENAEKAGPVEDSQLEELVRQGKIQPDTLVWCEGMADWRPYSQARPGAPGVAAPAPGPAVLATTAAGPEAVCAECGKIFPLQDMISYSGTYVCAACKPAFVQKLAEGAKLNTGALNFASVPTRFAAVFLDGLILWVVNTGINLVAGVGMFNSAGPGTYTAGQRGQGFSAVFILIFVLEMAIGLGYESFMIGKYGATLGKMACKIRVVTADGGRVTYGRALGRYFSKFLSGILCAIGYIMAIFDSEKRALHDRICNTRVVIK